NKKLWIPSKLTKAIFDEERPSKNHGYRAKIEAESEEPVLAAFASQLGART
ncbi:hypothetical protein STEG23_038292, partial [Scotinomys teguina]